MSAKSAKASLVQSFSTVYEQVSILDRALQSRTNFKALKQIDATHVAIGIQWGGNVFISVEDQNRENEDVEKIEGNLGVQMQLMLGSISGEGSVNISESEKAKLSQCSFEIYGDLVPKKVPETIVDALKFMKTSPELILNANDEKGKAIKYFLLPIRGLKKLWNIKMEMANLVRQIDMTAIKNFVKLFDELQTSQYELNDAVEITRHIEIISLHKN